MSPVVDAFLLTLIAVAGLAVLMLLRGERQRTEAGVTSATHPFVIGVYRGLAVVVVGFTAYTTAGIVISAMTGGPP